MGVRNIYAAIVFRYESACVIYRQADTALGYV